MVAVISPLHRPSQPPSWDPAVVVISGLCAITTGQALLPLWLNNETTRSAEWWREVAIEGCRSLQSHQGGVKNCGPDYGPPKIMTRKFTIFWFLQTTWDTSEKAIHLHYYLIILWDIEMSGIKIMSIVIFRKNNVL